MSLRRTTMPTTVFNYGLFLTIKPGTEEVTIKYVVPTPNTWVRNGFYM
jgi:hypothetical protein